jgi:triacylglycerol lipase
LRLRAGGTAEWMLSVGMRRFLLPLWAGLVFLTPCAPAAPFGVECRAGAGDYVVLVHGLDWFRDTMEPASEFLNGQGYETINVRYPSRKISNPSEAADWVRQVIRERCQNPRKRINLVAHSMGALVVREYLADGKPDRLGRVVFMAAPNQGSPIAQPLQWKPLGKLVAPAVAVSCCPDPSAASLPPKADFAPGILMGNRPGWFPYLSPFIKGPDDGVVAVESGRMEGMADFRVVTVSHTRMPKNPLSLREVAEFLRMGRFSPLE